MPEEWAAPSVTRQSIIGEPIDVAEHSVYSESSTVFQVDSASPDFKTNTMPLEGAVMLNLAITLFVIALIAALLGFTGIAGGLAGIAQIVFYVFLVLFLISAVSAAMRGRAPM